MNAKLLQISVNPQGGPLKHRVAQAKIETNGVVGDKQNDRRYHGGPERAVCLYSWELIRELQDEGHPIEPGKTGENLTIAGLDWTQMRPGVRLQIGEVELEIVSFTAPCYKIASNFVDGDFKRISQKVRPGWSRVYACVLREGVVREGDSVEVLAADEQG